MLSIKIFYKVFLFFFCIQHYVVFSAPLEILSKSIIIQNDQNELRINEPIIIKDSVKIKADRLIYNKKEKTALLEGNVIAQSLDWIIQAEKAFVNEKNDEILFEELALFDGSKWYIKAEKARALQSQVISLEEISLTQCTQEDPYWEIYLQSLELNKNRSFATGYNGAFFLHSIPLLYLPVIFSPTVLERKSGFLVPEYLQRNSADPAVSYGSRLKIPYFIALDDEHDITLVADWLEKKGEAVEIEYNYAFLEGMSGKFLAWRLDENRTRRKRETEKSKTINDPAFLERYKIDYQHRQNIFFDQQLYLEFLKNSDNEINKDYFQSETDFEIAQKQKITLSKSWNNGGYDLTYFQQNQFRVQSRYDLSTDQNTAVSQVPNFLIFQRIDFPDVDFKPTLSNQIVNFQREQGWQGIRNHFALNNMAERSLFDVFKFQAHLAYNVLHYRIDYKQTDAIDQSEYNDEFTHHYFNNRLSLSMGFIRDFYNENNLVDQRFTLTPKIKYRFVSDFDQRLALHRDPINESITNKSEDYENFDVIFDEADRVYAQSNYSLILEAQLDFKNFIDNEINNKFFLSVEDTYNLLRKDTLGEQEDSLVGPQLDEKLQQSPLGEKRLPLKINFRLTHGDYFQAQYFGRYDYRKNKALEKRYQFKVIPSDAYQFEFQEHFNQADYQKLNGDKIIALDNFVFSNQINLADLFIINTTHQWDNQNSVNFFKVYDHQSINIRFNNCCYALIFSIEQKRINNDDGAGKIQGQWDTLFSLNFNIDDQSLTKISL